MDRLKPCGAVYKDQFPNGVPICDACCALCNSTPGMGGKKGDCEHLKQEEGKRV